MSLSKRTTNNSTVVNLEDQNRVLTHVLEEGGAPVLVLPDTSIEKTRSSKGKAIL